MTTDSTEAPAMIPTISEETHPLWSPPQRAEGERYGVWSDRQEAGVKRYNLEVGGTSSIVGTTSIIVVYAATPDTVLRQDVTIRQFGNYFVVDSGEPLGEFPDEYQATVNQMRENGRPVLADQLIEMLEDQEPDEAKISLVSLREMARLLVEQMDFDDPSIGADRHGLVHAQWTIAGNGILIWGFLEDKRILMVAQADESSIAPDGLDINERLPAEKVLDTYGHLVPRRR